MTKKIKSTVEEFVDSLTPEQKKQYDQEYEALLLSEMVLTEMKQNNISVRELARLAGVSPTVVQGIKSGTRKQVTGYNIFKVLRALGFNLIAEKKDKRIPIIISRGPCTQINQLTPISYYAKKT